MRLDTKELKNITLLYVEDDKLIKEQTEQILAKIFKKVYSAADGQSGLDIFEQHHHQIDAIVTDINMPRMDGLKMIENIYKIKDSIAVIVTTAHTDSDFFINAIDLNVDKYITKPIQIKELALAVVDNVLKYRRTANIENLAKSLVSKSTKDDSINNKLTHKVDLLEKQSNYYKAIIDNFVINLRSDKNGNIVEVSDKFKRVFNYSKEEIVGENINILKYENCSQESFQKLMLKAIHTKKTVTSTHILITNDNKTIKGDVTLSPNYNSNALVDGYTIFIDII